VLEDNFLFACASNADQAGGGMRIAPGASINDGILNVNLIRDASLWEALGQIRRLSRGTHITHPKVRFFPARSLAVETRQDIEVTADGEIIGRTPVQFEVVPKAIRTLVP